MKFIVDIYKIFSMFGAMEEKNPEHSVRRDRFTRLAVSRVERASEALRLIGNLSNKSNYEYTDQEVKKIFAALQSELNAAKSRFRDNSKQRKFEL